MIDGDGLAAKGVIVWVAIGGELIKEFLGDGNDAIGRAAGNTTRTETRFIISCVANEIFNFAS